MTSYYILSLQRTVCLFVSVKILRSSLTNASAKRFKKQWYSSWMLGLRVSGYCLKASVVVSACPPGNIKVVKNVSTFTASFWYRPKSNGCNQNKSELKYYF